MPAWSAPAPGGTTVSVGRPGSRLSASATPGATTLSAAAPGGRHLRAPAPPFTSTHPTRTAALTTETTLSVDTLPVIVAGAPLAAAATLSVDHLPRVPLPAMFSAGATLAVDVLVVGEDIEVEVGFATAGTLTVHTVPVLGPHGAPLAAEATLSVSALPRFIREAAFGPDATLSVIVVPRIPRTAPFSASASLAVQVLPRFTRTAGFSVGAVLAAATKPRLFTTAAFGTDVALSVAIALTTDASDDFNRPDGTLGANWTTFAYGTDTTVVPRVIGQQFRAPATLTNNQNNQCSAIYTGQACTKDDMASRATMTAGENGLFMGPIVRASADGNNFVVAAVTSDTTRTGIHTRIGATVTRRTTTSTTIFAANDVFELRAVGNVYSLIRNPDGAATTISTWTDSGGLFPTGASQRFGGLFHNSDRNIFGAQNNAPPLDNFRVRDL